MENEQEKVVLKRQGDDSVDSGRTAVNPQALESQGISPEDRYDESLLNSGKIMTKGIAIFILLLRVVDAVGALVGVTMYINPAYIVGIIAGIFITGLFLYYMYHGRRWARIVVYIQQGFFSVFGLYTMMSTGLIDVLWVFLYVGMAGALMFILLNNKIKTYLEYQGKKHKNILVEPKELN